MPTFTILSQGNGATTPPKVASPSTATVQKNSIDPKQGSISVLLDGPCLAGATLTSSAVSRPAGCDIVIAGLSTSAGTLVVEESTNGGSTWVNADSDPVAASDYVNSRATVPGAVTHYRIKFICGPVGATKVHFTGQCRT